MKIIRSRKPTMKTCLSTAILLSFLWSLNLNPALAQPAPAPVLPDPNGAPTPGVDPTPSDEPTGVPTTGRRFGVGGGGGGGGGGGVGGGGVGGLAQSGAYYSAYAKAHGYHA